MKPIENSCGKNISTSNHRSYREELLWGGCRNGRIPKSSKLLSVLKNRESDCFGLAKSQETPIRTIRLHFFNDFFCLNSQFQLIMIMFNSKIAIFGRSTFSDIATWPWPRFVVWIGVKHSIGARCRAWSEQFFTQVRGSIHSIIDSPWM